MHAIRTLILEYVDTNGASHIRELHIEVTALRSERSTWDPKIKDLEHDIRTEKDRFGNLFKLAEDLDLELKEARRSLEARDRWFKKNILVMSNIKRAMEERDEMIESASHKGYEADLEGELTRVKPIK